MLIFWLFIIVLAAIAWFAMRGRAVRRIEAARDYARRGTEEAMRRRNASGDNAPKNGKPAGEIEELVKCAVCGAYVSPRAGNCGKDGCPR
ncbi:MAG TPA: hypothetical protein PL096_01595 [Micropepsaceae bacterium]|nr:hypothetical protein [Micropepsaceae bacterium]